MRETVFYLRGQLPFGPEFGIPDGLIRDTKTLLDLETGQIEAVRRELEAFPGFLDQTKTEKLIGSVIEDRRTCGALARLIANLDRRLRATGQGVDGLLSHIGEWLKDEANQRKSLLSESEFEQVKARLPLVLRPIPGLERQAKAERLSQATGLPLEKIEIICDLRPVFDKERDHVEGVIPYTTLRIVCKGADGLPVALEAILSQQDVSRLAKASANAEKKLARLRDLLAEKQLPIPRTNMTMEAGDNE
jgi:hypothetical protein